MSSGQRSRPESPSAMFSWFRDATKFRKFLKTRRLVRAGVPVYKWSSDLVTKEGILGPWTFNVYESVVAAAPSMVLVALVEVVWGPAPNASQDEALRLGLKFLGYAQPLILPFSLLLLSWVASWSSLRRIDSSREKRVVGKYAYLYFDGSYGLALQMIVVLGLTIQSLATSYYDSLTYSTARQLFLGSALMAGIGSVCLVVVSFRTVPRLLFMLHGYSGEAPPAFQRPANSGPWLQYQLSMWLVGTLGIYFLLDAIGLACGLLGRYVAGLKGAIGTTGT